MNDLHRFTVHLNELLFTEAPPPALVCLQGRCVVANGCFDVLHPGHLALFDALSTIAYQAALRPVVALNSDASVRSLKGLRRPIVPQEARAILINSLKWPLAVVIFDEETPQLLMDTLRPPVVVKGSEYAPDSVIRWADSQVVTVDMLHSWSTSRIIGANG